VSRRITAALRKCSCDVEASGVRLDTCDTLSHNHYTNILRRVRIMTTYVVASNGVIHVIDAVLLPTA